MHICRTKTHVYTRFRHDLGFRVYEIYIEIGIESGAHSAESFEFTVWIVDIWGRLQEPGKCHKGKKQ